MILITLPPQAVRAWGGSVIKIVRPDNPFTPKGDSAKHASEVELDSYNDWDLVIENSGDLESLRRLSDKILGSEVC